MNNQLKYMSAKMGILFSLVLFFGQTFAQQNETVNFSKIFSVDSVYYTPNNLAPSEVKLTNVKTYVTLLGSNFKQTFTKPFHMSKKDWQSLGDFSFMMIGVSILDQPIQQTALNHRTNHPRFNEASNFISHFGADYEIYSLMVIGTYGLIIKDQKLKNTTLLATQAFITAGSVATVLKIITGRDRPSYYGTDEVAAPTFRGPYLNNKNGHENSFSSSFPSGHATVAFAAATVFALEYRDKPIIPFIAYSAASLVSVSRITENKHWLSDVVVGAALGYLSGKQVVNNYHRYANQQENEKKKTQYSFQLNYNMGHLEPGLIVRFP
jgi:hypothetical protein